MHGCLATALLAVASPAGATIDSAIAAYNEDRFLAAAEQFWRSDEQAASPDDRAKATYYGARSLEKAGLRWAAAHGYLEIVEAGPNHPYHLEALAQLLEHEGSVAASLLAPPGGYACGRAFRACMGEGSEAALTLIELRPPCGRSSIHEAQDFSPLGPGRPQHALGLYLLGVLHARAGEWTQARQAFLRVKVTTYEEPLATLAELGLARAAYAEDDFAGSAAAYDRVVLSGGPYAPVARSEAAWPRLLLGAGAEIAAEDAGQDLQVGADAAAARLLALGEAKARAAAQDVLPKLEATLEAVARGQLTHPSDVAALGAWQARLASVADEQRRAEATLTDPFRAKVLVAQAAIADRLREARDGVLQRRAALRRHTLLRVRRVAEGILNLGPAP